MHSLALDEVILGKRLGRLLNREASYDSKRDGNEQLSTVQLQMFVDSCGNSQRLSLIRAIESVGRLALIGGAVRDVAREGVRLFKSDLDFVVYDSDLPGFVRLMGNLGGVKNRFGGYRVQLGSQHIDVWALEHTWARTAGVMRVETLPDLLNCTFFDWDAVLYDLDTRRILSKPSYLPTVKTRILDINLLANPNPKGSLVRALRRGFQWKVAFGPTLTSFVRNQLRVEMWSELVSLDERAFKIPLLQRIDRADLHARLSKYKVRGDVVITEPFGCSDQHLQRSIHKTKIGGLFKI